ncbi:MAG: NADH:flavin oxidoreductase/NADH oxidase [Bifidobacteriaceae bacterium]|jgi:2,4-dienoyl-CoA reductase-like NADH-dependent reductase (Old Yellow Enzyme family)|nr:NADH:flavin oxidoreductase/NADH oxidase [Bifidobacteriaceae bacterium]
MSQLFTPIHVGPLTVRNRLWVSPMCQYSSDSKDGLAHPWHVAHYGALAQGRPGLIMLEATAVVPQGRITPWDLGLWEDRQIEGLAGLAGFMRGQGVVPAIQLGHAGRKGSVSQMWAGSTPVPAAEGGYETYAPSAIGFGDLPVPHELTAEQIAGLVEAFAAAAARAAAAGFEAIELHAAHGYLLHQFLSPLSNQRRDQYGGSLENRCRFPLEVVAAVRWAIGPDRALLMRISATDWAEGGWDLDQSVEFVSWAKEAGLDHIDVSTGGLVADAKIPVAPGYQAPFAAAIRQRVGLSANTVAVIETAAQAESLIEDGAADAVMLGRPFLRDPNTAVKWATQLGLEPTDWCPPQYSTAGWRRYHAPSQ